MWPDMKLMYQNDTVNFNWKFVRNYAVCRKSTFFPILKKIRFYRENIVFFLKSIHFSFHIENKR